MKNNKKFIDFIQNEFEKEYENQQIMQRFFEWKKALFENEKIDKSKEFIHIIL